MYFFGLDLIQWLDAIGGYRHPLSVTKWQPFHYFSFPFLFSSNFQKLAQGSDKEQ
jgi:hypothetical protein